MWRPALDDISTTEPWPRSYIAGRKARRVRKAVVRLRSSVARQLSRLSSTSGVSAPPPPAQATSNCGGPKAVRAATRSASDGAAWVRSAAKAAASPPARRIDCTTDASAASSRPVTTTFAPRLASARAVPAPMPRAPPVTSATRPAKSRAGSDIAGRRHGHERQRQQTGRDALADGGLASRRAAALCAQSSQEHRAAGRLQRQRHQGAGDAESQQGLRRAKSPTMGQPPEPAAAQHRRDGGAHLRHEEALELGGAGSRHGEGEAGPPDHGEDMQADGEDEADLHANAPLAGWVDIGFTYCISNVVGKA